MSKTFAETLEKLDFCESPLLFLSVVLNQQVLGFILSRQTEDGRQKVNHVQKECEAVSLLTPMSHQSFLNWTQHPAAVVVRSEKPGRPVTTWRSLSVESAAWWSAGYLLKGWVGSETGALSDWYGGRRLVHVSLAASCSMVGKVPARGVRFWTFQSPWGADNLTPPPAPPSVPNQRKAQSDLMDDTAASLWLCPRYWWMRFSVIHGAALPEECFIIKWWMSVRSFCFIKPCAFHLLHHRAFCCCSCLDWACF